MLLSERRLLAREREVREADCESEDDKMEKPTSVILLEEMSRI
jgi:hypothetical protein